MGTIAKNVEKNTALTAKQGNTTKDLVNRYLPEIEKALPNVGITPERFARLTISALSQNPKLASCDQKSFLGAMIQSAQLGLEPNSALQQAYLIPYGNQVQFQIGYKGLIKLAYNSESMSNIYAEVICENDEYEYQMGVDSKLVHKPLLRGDRGKPIAYYAVYKTKDGGYSFCVMSRDDIMAHAKKFSKTFGNGPWQTNFDEMAKKTVLKRLLKYAPLSTDMAHAVAADNSVSNGFFKEGSMLENDFVYVQGDADDSEFIGDEPQDFPPYTPDPETGEIGG